MSIFIDVIVCKNEGENGNQITRAQAAIAEAKNWNLSIDKYTELGDVNGDGVVDVADIATIISVMADSSNVNAQAADVMETVLSMWQTSPPSSR